MSGLAIDICLILGMAISFVALATELVRQLKNYHDDTPEDDHTEYGV